MLRSIVCALGVLLLLTGVVRAQNEVEELLDDVWPDRPRHPDFADPIGPESPNAAGRYFWLFDRFDERLKTLAVRFRADKLAFEPDPAGAGATPDEIAELRAKLVEQRTWIRALVAAARMKQFDLHYAEGLVSVPLPPDDPRRDFLMNARRACAVLHADAIRLWLDGEHAEAAERLIGALGLVVHVGHLPSSMIDQVFAHALLGVTHRTIMLFLAEGQPDIPEGQRRELLDMLDALDAHDPLGRRKGWKAYRHAARAFAGEQLRDGEIGEPLLLQLGLLKGLGVIMDDSLDRLLKRADQPRQDAEADEVVAETARMLESLTHEQLTAHLKNIDRLTARIEKAWEEPDGEAKIKAMREEIDADESGLTGFVLVLPDHAQREWRETVAWIRELRERLERPK